MRAAASSNGLRFLLLPFTTSKTSTTSTLSSLLSITASSLTLSSTMENSYLQSHGGASSVSASSLSRKSGRGSGSSEQRTAKGGGAGKEARMDKIDALGRLLTRILRHMATELNLDMRSDGYVRVRDLLELNMTTYANIRLKAHTIDDIREAVRKDYKQRFSLLEENGKLLIRANQGHTITSIKSEDLLKPILSADEAPVCVHGTYKKNLDSILDSGLKRMARVHVHFSSGLPTDGEVISDLMTSRGHWPLVLDPSTSNGSWVLI